MVTGCGKLYDMEGEPYYWQSMYTEMLFPDSTHDHDNKKFYSGRCGAIQPAGHWLFLCQGCVIKGGLRW